MGEKKKPAKGGSASGGKTKSIKKPAATKRPVKRATKKVTKQVIEKNVIEKKIVKKAVRLTPAVTAVPLPMAVDPLLHQPLRRTQQQDRMSLRRHIISAFSLVAVSVVALAVIAGFAQVTFMDITSMNAPMMTLLKPVATESRLFPSMAGELIVAMPTTWTMTAEADNTLTYTHTTATDATMTVTVQQNDTDNILTWLQAHQPNYTKAVVVESSEAVTAWRGITVTAETTNGVPLQIVYLPIQKNLGERYIVSIQAAIPSDEAELFVPQAFEALLENFSTSLD